jgi:hypothetical protein
MKSIEIEKKKLFFVGFFLFCAVLLSERKTEASVVSFEADYFGHHSQITIEQIYNAPYNGLSNLIPAGTGNLMSGYVPASFWADTQAFDQYYLIYYENYLFVQYKSISNTYPAARTLISIIHKDNIPHLSSDNAPLS